MKTKRKVKVYISSFMSAAKNSNRNNFIRQKEVLEREGVEVLSPHILEGKYPNKSYSFYLKKALKMLLDADIIFFFGYRDKRFKLSYGVNLEMETASKTNIPAVRRISELRKLINNTEEHKNGKRK